MAKLPNIKRIMREEFKEAPTWIERLLSPINTFFESVYEALNRNITFKDNINCQIKELSFATGSAYDGTTAHFTAVTFLSTLKRKAEGLILLQITQDADNYAPIEGDVFVNWIDVNGEIKISLIRGLSASKSYKLRVLLM